MFCRVTFDIGEIFQSPFGFEPVEQAGSQFEMCSVMEMSVFAAAHFPFIREAEKLLDTCHINHSTAAEPHTA